MPRWETGLFQLWKLAGGRCFLVLVATQIISLVMSTMLSTRMPLSFFGTVWRRFGLIEQTAILVIATALAAAVAATPDLVTPLCRAITAGGMLASTYGILQYFGVDPFLDPRLYSIEYFGGVLRPPSTMGHALYFSSWLVTVVFVAGSLARGEASRGWRIMHGSAVALGGIAIGLTGTRSALLALLAGGIVFIVRGRRGGGAHSRLRMAAATATVLLIPGGVVLSPAGANLRTRVLQWRTETGGPRLQMWRESPGLIGQTPLWGAGPETFAAEFRRVQSAALSRQYPDFYNETPHNAFIDAACAQGVPGFLILAGVFALAFSAGRGSVSDYPLRAGLSAAMVALFVSLMFASLTLITSMMLWSLAGLSVALRPVRGGAKYTGKFRMPMLPAVIVGGAFLLCGVSLAVRDAAWADLGRAVEARDFAVAGRSLTTATTALIDSPGYELWGSRQMATLGRSLGNTPDKSAAWVHAAEAAALAETRGDEPFSAAYQSAVLAVAAGNLGQADVAARRVVRLAPNWYKGHLLLSQLLGAEGKRDAAENEARISAGLGWSRK